jgi:NAD(P)-dependent dehydrogenase (short-subunit alcohol dehydrogenase family)
VDSGGLTGLVNNAAGNFIAPTESLSPRAFDAIANIVFHGTFYVTQAVGKRWVAQAKAGEWKPATSLPQRDEHHHHLGRQRQPLRGALGHEQGRHRRDDQVAGGGMGAPRRAPERRRPRRDPTEGMSKRLNPGEEPGARSRAAQPDGAPGKMSELQNLAAFLMAPGQCDWLTGQSIMMDGGNALATGGNFYELRDWSDADWQAARERIEAQNAKDKAQR